MVRQCTVNALTGGSNPSLGANLLNKLGDSQAGKATDSESVMPRFESWSPIQGWCVFLGCRQVGKAGDFESPMRWFESSHPIQADVVQRQECNHAKVEAEGSSPSIRSKVFRAGIAQSAQRRFRKAEVVGSFPIPGSRVCR